MNNKCIIIFGDTTYIYTGQSERNIYGKNHYISEILEHFLSFLISQKLFDLTDGSTTVDSKMVETGVDWKQWAANKLSFAEHFLAMYG